MKNRKLGLFMEIPDEFRKVLEIETFKETEYIFEQNCQELADTLSYTEENRKDLKRKLHNFLTANSTIIDHTRKLLKSCPEISKEIETRIKKEFENDLISNFIKNLRNYITHYSLPVVMRPLKKEKDSFVIGSVVLDKNTLLKWNGWNTQSKLFLTESKSDLIIGDIISEHYKKMASLYNWIENLMQKEYKDVFDRYDKYINNLFTPKNKS